ncbi:MULTISPECIES: PAS domain S-box protein [Cyanophyceae]|uniref:PAS domain-containing hybrid sensor histidine kinase/response regulator n=1 Tax=Cyanophyceae TaxID=3028117 RepID=UPI001687B1BE|nr:MULTISPECIES: PAS domain S-box protein [Cyanophyceae]MBD1918767.1 PAS domain S-box protein [Phormidium sp. FACHB-77]MBD2033420.1 PAS domain S-box protein [Phormidium sp. FACHB-322]MBD2053919.1 PAS domain S-box protein [Leptolyngbya sp. FACHB-60]
MSPLTLFCCVDAPAQVPALLAAEFSDCRVVLATKSPAVADGLDQLSTDEVAVAIVTASWLTTGDRRSFCDRFPQALVVVLDPTLSLTDRPSPEPEPIYRRLPYPGTDAELVFTVAAALKHYRQGQQLKLSNVALDDAHRQLDVLQRRMSALMVQLDWGMASASDRTQTEQALRRSRSSLAEAQRIAQLGSWEFDLACQTITWSAEMFRLHGLAPALCAPSYEQWQQTMPPEDWRFLEAAIEQSIALGTPYEVEHRLVRPDGSVRYILGRGEAVYNDQGQVVKLRGTGQDRTEARLAEVALRQSEAKNQAIFSAVPDLMAVVNAQGQYVDFAYNHFLGELLPQGGQDIVGAYLADVLPPELAREWLTAVERTLATGICQFFEQQLSFGDRIQYEVVRMVPYQTDQVLVLVRDISDRQQALYDCQHAEQAQQESDTRFRQLAETVREGFFVFDAVALRYEYLNPAYATITGIDLAAINDLDHWLTGVHPEDRDRVAVAAAQEMQGTSTDCEYRFLRPDGEVRWLHCQAFPIADAAGTVLRVVGTVKDITARKQAELALEQTKERYRRATQAARTGVWELDLKVQRGYLDPTIKALAGYADNDIGDSLEDWLRLVHPEDHAPLKTAMQRYFSSESAKFFFEYRMLHRDGSMIWVLSRGELHRDAEGQPETFLGTTTDITTLKQAELALKQLNEELEQRVQERTQTLQTLAAVVENSTDLIGTASLSGAALYLNRAGRRLVGLEDVPVDGQPISTLHTAETRLRLEQEVLPTVMAEGVWRGESAFCHGQTGEAIAVEQVIFLVKDPDTQVPLCLATISRDIRDRKRSELAIQESEARFRQIAEATQEVFWMITADTRQTLYVSPGFERIWGLSCEALYQSPSLWLNSIHPDDRPAVEVSLPATTTVAVDKVYRIYRADGELRWISDRSFPVLNEAGEIYRVVGVSTDITERRQAELSLQENEELFRGIFEQSALGIIEADLDERIVRVNQIFCDLVGYSTADLLTMTYTHLTHADDVNLDRTHVEPLLRGDLPSFMIEKRYVRSDGSTVWVALAVSLMRNAQGQPQYLLGVVNDISDRKQAELALQESRNMLKLVLDTIPQRVFWKDRQSRFLGCNPAFAKDYGLTPDCVIGKTDAGWPWDSYAAKYQADDRQVMATRQPKLGYEERATTVDGKDLWTLTSKVPLTNADDVVIGVLGCYEDITARKQVEASLLQLNQQLEQRVQERTWELERSVQVSEAANQAKSTFLANMSHELRTPLNAILGFAQLMARDATLSGDHSQALRIINRSGEHLLMLINDILEMAKIEAGQVSLNAVRFDLHALLNALSDMLHLRAQDKGLELVLDCHPTLPRYVVADEPKLRQVLINLLGNAIKFTPAGQVTLRVTPARLTSAPLPGALLAVTFAVADTGIGITPADRDRLFEPFVQVGQGAGTGLGLSISRQFVQMLGSDITVESQPGQGSTFTFTLPMQVADGVDGETPSPFTQITGLATGQPRYRILVVDDDSTHRHLLGEVLRAVGFEVREGDNGQTALDLWQQWRPQLIWLDMRMPTLSGPETACALRAQEQGTAAAPTKIIALTANAFEDDRARALASGCDDFVRKPFQFDHVLAKLAEHLGVEYTYSPVLAPLDNAVRLSAEAAIAQLRSLPPLLLAQLQQATVQLDGDRLTQLLTQIPPEQKTLIDWLSWQVDEFAFDILHSRLEKAQRQ